MKLNGLAALLVLAISAWQFADLVCSVVAMAIGIGIVLFASRLPVAKGWQSRSVRWTRQVR